MKIHFHKYQGTGNDFVILDNRNSQYNDISKEQVKRICERRFGIGADGLMMLNDKAGYDFEMKYYNSDGMEGSMCGNGGKCMVKFSYQFGIHRDDFKFFAVESEKEAKKKNPGPRSLKMKKV